MMRSRTTSGAMKMMTRKAEMGRTGKRTCLSMGVGARMWGTGKSKTVERCEIWCVVVHNALQGAGKA